MPYTTINKPSQYFNTVLYTGDGTTSRSITGVGFKPDFTWIKSRSNAYYHELYDAVRGFSSTTNGRVLYSNTTSAEGTPNTFNSFNTDGFTVSNQSGETGTNGSGATFVSWSWLGANTTVSNTSGTITSTVSANTTSGFSIVSYTGTGANATVGHGLGVAPKMVIVKGRNSAPDYWFVYHSGLTNATYSQYLSLAIAEQSGQADKWNSTAPATNVFSIGTNSGVNQSTYNFIAYCFAEVKGFSKIDKYIGNGSTDGTFIYTGFKPAFVMAKANSTTGQWAICDNKRGAANILNNNGEFLFAESNEATNSAPSNWDFLSNGFKARANYAANNTSGVTYIYIAFAENPFVTSGGIPVTAR